MRPPSHALSQGGGAASIERAKPTCGDWLCQCFYPSAISGKNELPVRSSFLLADFVLKIPLPLLGAMTLNAGQKMKKVAA